MRTDLLLEALSGIEDAYILESHPLSVAAMPRRERALTRFFGSGIGAAVIAGIVAVGVLVAIVMAGLGGGPGVTPAPGMSDTAESEHRSETEAKNPETAPTESLPVMTADPAVTLPPKEPEDTRPATPGIQITNGAGDYSLSLPEYFSYSTEEYPAGSGNIINGDGHGVVGDFDGLLPDIQRYVLTWDGTIRVAEEDLSHITGVTVYDRGLGDMVYGRDFSMLAYLPDGLYYVVISSFYSNGTVTDSFGTEHELGTGCQSVFTLDKNAAGAAWIPHPLPHKWITLETPADRYDKEFIEPFLDASVILELDTNILPPAYLDLLACKYPADHPYQTTVIRADDLPVPKPYEELTVRHYSVYTMDGTAAATGDSLACLRDLSPDAYYLILLVDAPDPLTGEVVPYLYAARIQLLAD